MAGYYKIARHYGYSLKHTFKLFNYEAIIVIEGFFENNEFFPINYLLFPFLDDLDVSPDFLDYFQALYPLLLRDETLYCISAWNDNGMDGTIYRDPSEKRRKVK